MIEVKPFYIDTLRTRKIEGIEYYVRPKDLVSVLARWEDKENIWIRGIFANVPYPANVMLN